VPLTVLSDLERRVIANLSIPRNVANLTHELRVDPYIATPAEEDTHKLLEALADEGWVVNMGDGRDGTPGELAAAVDSHKQAWSMPDEKALIFERRLALPHRAWRLAGDVWMLTAAGFDKLHETDSPAPMDRAQVERMIALHQRLVLNVPFDGSIHDDRGGVLGDDVPIAGGEFSQDAGRMITTLLPEEFADWERAVRGEFEDRTGEKLVPPLMGGAGYSDAWENLGIDAENGKATGFQITAPWYMALVTVAVTDADTGSTLTEATGATGYARKSVAGADMNTGASGSATNANAITFAAITAGSATVIGFCKCIAATVGTAQKYGTCASTVISATQTPPTFAAAAFTTSLD
jgi:hypothetical protein